MPLDGHSYLVAQGWGGKGTGLRTGAISRPVAIPQKKNLAGLGKDRDEAFPFWDHLFTAAAKSIQVKCFSDDEDETDETSNGVSLKRTSTGILSTRRPIDGTPAHSGTTTPNDLDSGSQTPRLSLMAQAKRDAAKRGLYSKFFRGPVLGPETIAEEEKRLASLVLEAFATHGSNAQSITVTEHIEVQMADQRVVVDLEVSRSSRKKRKATDTNEVADESDDDDDEAARKERKRRRKEVKRKEEEKDSKARLRQEKKAKKEKKKASSTSPIPGSSNQIPSPTKHSGKDDDNLAEKEKSERRRRKEEKKKLKALRQQDGGTGETVSSLEQGAAAEEEDVRCSERPKEIIRNPEKPKTGRTISGQEPIQPEKKKKKKKRKHADNPGE